MSEIKNVQEPQRIEDEKGWQGEEQEHEVRGYDARDSGKVIGEMSIDTKGAVSRVTHKKGPKPISKDTKTKEFTNEELDTKATERLEEKMKEIERDLADGLDSKLARRITRLHNMAKVIDNLFEDNSVPGALIRIAPESYGLGVISGNEIKESDLPHQKETQERREKFIKEIVKRSTKFIEDHLEKRLAKYKDLVGDRKIKITSELSNGTYNFYFETPEGKD
jgi:hypothetical protein